MVTNVKDFEKKCADIKCNFYTQTLDRFKNTSCECSHNAKVKQYEGECVRGYIIFVAIVSAIIFISILFYLYGMIKGEYYAATFGTGACYASWLWDEECEVIF